MQQKANNYSLTGHRCSNTPLSMASKLDPYCGKIQQWRLEGLSWRAVTEKLNAGGLIKATPDEVFRYMRNARKRAEKILAEVAPLQDLKRKREAGAGRPQGSSLSDPTAHGTIIAEQGPSRTLPSQSSELLDDLLAPRPQTSEDIPWNITTP